MMYEQDQNGTQSPSSLNKALLMGLAVAVFTIYTAIPSSLFAYAVTALFLLCAVLLNKQGFVATLIVTVAAYVLLGASELLLASILSTVAVAAVGGVMLSEKRSAVIYLASVGIAYGISALLLTPIDALSALTPIPLAIALALCAKFRVSRVSSVLTASAVYAATLLVPVVGGFVIKHGAESAEQFKLLLSDTRTAVIDAIVKIGEALPPETAELFPEVFTADVATAVVDLIFPLIPAIFIMVSNILGFTLHTVFLKLRRDLGDLPAPAELRFEMSSVSAWLYIISFVALLFDFSGSPTLEVIAVAAHSLNLILTPSFLFIGLNSALLLFRITDKRKRWLHVVFAVLALMYCTAFLIYPLVAIGVIETIRSKRPPHNSQMV